MPEQSNNKTIAKNTVLLYVRMLFTMVVSLYTSRVILGVLGIDDYGLYQVVGGVVAMLTFINGALATGTSRFLTFELGAGNFDKLRRTFSSVMTVHILLALFVALVAETAGLWFVYNKLVIPPERFHAAVIAYHFSILTAVFYIFNVPYNSTIIAHERMEIYAYMSIADVLAKLGICYLLTIGGVDKLVLYAILLFLTQVLVFGTYRFICKRNFEEAHYKPLWDKEILKGVLGYSGWNLFANTALALITQGSNILLNMFYSSTVVTAMSVSNQVNGAAQQFVNSFRSAANPQIVKKFAVGDLEGSRRLLLASTKYSFYLMLLLTLPVFLVTPELLSLWLKEVPEYTTIFIRFTIVTCLFQVFDTSFYTALYAKGRIKENALISPTLLFLLFPIVYVLFKLGMSPIFLSVGLLVSYALLGLVVKPILIVKIAGYSWKEIFQVFGDCLKVFVVSIIVPVTVSILVQDKFEIALLKFVVIVVVALASVCASVWLIGLDTDTKKTLVNFVKKRLQR